jgi:hypothetical protein
VETQAEDDEIQLEEDNSKKKNKRKKVKE